MVALIVVLLLNLFTSLVNDWILAALWLAIWALIVVAWQRINKKHKVKKVTTNIPTPRELVDAAIKKHLQPSKMYDILDEMARTIALVPDPLRREVYVKSLSDEFKFDIETLRNQVNYKRKINERQA